MLTIHVIQDADDTLAKIGRLNRDIDAERVMLDDAIAELTRVSAEKLKPVIDERNDAEKILLEYIKRNKRDFSEQRTTELTFGTIGVRNYPGKPSVERGLKAEDVAKRLYKIKRFRNLVKVKYSLIKNALKGMENAASTLAKYGIRFSQKKDQPFYTINESKIDEQFPLT
ncbi:MAG: host-nuclease inhibitor Gam family protein [Bacteroidota bacterium]